MDPLSSWARGHASEDSLFVGTGLWDLRYRTGAIVLTDGYPEMPPLEPGAVPDLLRRQGARFRTVYLVFGGAGSPTQEDGRLSGRLRARPEGRRALAW